VIGSLPLLSTVARSLYCPPGRLGEAPVVSQTFLRAITVTLGHRITVVRTAQRNASPAITAADTSTANEEPSTTMWVAATATIIAGMAGALSGRHRPNNRNPTVIAVSPRIRPNTRSSSSQPWEETVGILLSRACSPSPRGEAICRTRRAVRPIAF